MGGGLAADDLVDTDLSEFLMVSKPSSEDGSVLDVTTCDFGLKQNPETQVEDDPKTNTPELPMISEYSPENVSLDLGLQLNPANDSTADLAEIPMVSETSPENNASVLEVACDSSLQQKTARTLVLLGRSGNGKSATGNSILGRQAFKSRGRASGVTTACELQSSTLPNGQILNVIDTPGLFSLYPSTEFTCKEILKCLSLSKEGIDAVLVVFSLKNRLTEEEKSALFALKILFGSGIVEYMIIVFTNEDALDDDGDTFESYLSDCSDFKEILKAYNDRKVLFTNRAKAPESQKAKQVQELLNYVEEIAKKNGKPYMGDLSHEIRENETAFHEKQRWILEMSSRGLFTKQEMSEMMKDNAKSYENQQLTQMMERMESKLKETQKMLEQQLNKEKAAVLESEKRAKEAEKHSSDVVEKLKEEVARLALERRVSEVKKNSNDVIKMIWKDLAREFQEKAKQCTIL